MTAYLLNCECGKQVRVDVGQAGGRVACSCGAQLDVPTLRKLRHLPVVPLESGRQRAAWNARKGIVTASLLLAAVLASIAIWNRFTEPPVPELDFAGRLSAFNESMKQLPPADAWQMWIEMYRPLAESGFAAFEHRDAAVVEHQIEQSRFLQSTLFILAGVCAAVALTAALWPRRVIRR